MFQINYEALITKINNRNHFHVEFQLLQSNWWLHNGWTFICHIFKHLYKQNRRRSVKPTHPRFFKRVNVDLNSAARFASTSSKEIPTNKQRFVNAHYPPRLVNSVIRQFNEKCNDNTQDDYIIPPDFFNIPKSLVLADILYSSRNETLSKSFIKKFHELNNNS